MTSEARTTRQQQALERREQIVETALQLFAKQGFDGTSTKQIAQAAGITEGLIFHYFATKADLLTAVLETRHSFIIDLRTILQNEAERPVEELLPRLANAWMETLRREREITLMIFTTAQINPTVGQAFRTLVAEGQDRLAVYLRLAVARGELRADLPVESAAQIFFTTLIMFFFRYHNVPVVEWEARAKTFVEEMISIWLNGARP